MEVYSQSRVFCIFFLLGTVINFIFDLFRGVRKSFKFSNIIVFIQDITFLVIAGFLFFRTLILFNNGEIRFYMLIALIFGICIYTLTISKHCVIMINVILKICKKIFHFLFKFVFYIINKIFMPFNIIKKGIIRIIKKTTKFREKNQGRIKKNIEYIK